MTHNQKEDVTVATHLHLIQLQSYMIADLKDLKRLYASDHWIVIDKANELAEVTEVINQITTQKLRYVTESM